MKSFVVQSKARPILSAASKLRIQNYFAGLTSATREKRWLETSNRYRITCTKTFEQDVKRAEKRGKALSAEKCVDLTAYIGASSPAHIIDGWSFIGRAIDSAMRGDTYSAAHFAYYAELRAAMALLASEGIGIFNGKHAIVELTKITPFPTKSRQGTHQLIWPVFRFWSSLRRATDLLDELIQPEQIRLSNWLNKRKTSVSVRAVAQKWLSNWGIDLNSIQEDHHVRNLASYRPSQFRRPVTLDTAKLAEFISSLWNLFEPGKERRFQNIERQLLLSAWRMDGEPAPQIEEIEQVGLSPIEAKNWVKFLTSSEISKPLFYAEETAPIEDSTCHLRMISRAALLLFVASGAARQLLTKAGYSVDTIAFWWKQHGEERGLWSPNKFPDDPLDAWADVAESIEKLILQGSQGSTSLHELMQSQHGFSKLGAFELVGIWSLLP